MKIEINDTRKISAIQEEFNSGFPYLKLEFFSIPRHLNRDFSKKIFKHNSNVLANCRSIHISGEINIQPLMTVQELEQFFLDEYVVG
mgnify:CR=1 FL=1